METKSEEIRAQQFKSNESLAEHVFAYRTADEQVQQEVQQLKERIAQNESRGVRADYDGSIGSSVEPRLVALERQLNNCGTQIKGFDIALKLEQTTRHSYLSDFIIPLQKEFAEFKNVQDKFRSESIARIVRLQQEVAKGEERDEVFDKAFQSHQSWFNT